MYDYIDRLIVHSKQICKRKFCFKLKGKNIEVAQSWFSVYFSPQIFGFVTSFLGVWGFFFPRTGSNNTDITPPVQDTYLILKYIMSA